MGKMFKIKYLQIVNNDELPKPGDLTLTLYGTTAIDSPSLFIIGFNKAGASINFSKPTLAQVNGRNNMTSVSTIKTTTNTDTINLQVSANDTVDITVNKYYLSAITQVSVRSDSQDLGYVKADLINDFRYSPLNTFSIYRSNNLIYCDFDNIPDNYMPTINSLTVGGPNVKGTPSFDDLVCKNITERFALINTACTGDFHVVANNVTNLQFNYTNNLNIIVDSVPTACLYFLIQHAKKLTCDLSVFKEIKTIMQLDLSYGANVQPSTYKVTGDISNLASLKYLKSMTLAGSEITGDISVFGNMPNLISAYFYTPNISGDVTDIVTNCTKLTYLLIPSSVTITDEQKTTLTNRGCTVVING